MHSSAASTPSGSSSGVASPTSPQIDVPLPPNTVAATPPKKRSSHHPSPPTGPVINLRLILVSGKTRDFHFSPTESAGEIAQFVFDHWPEDWTEESVSSAEILRLIYQGRFLHGNVTLAALGLPTGKTTVMHLVPRESLPEPNSQDDEKKKKSRSSSCCCSCSLQ